MSPDLKDINKEKPPQEIPLLVEFLHRGEKTVVIGKHTRRDDKLIWVMCQDLLLDFCEIENVQRWDYLPKEWIEEHERLGKEGMS